MAYLKDPYFEKILSFVLNNTFGQDLEDGLKVVSALRVRSNYSEFDLAKDLDLNIKHLRKILYALFQKNLVFWRRKKDRKKGWYIYYWTFKDDYVPFKYNELLNHKIEQLKKRLLNEENNDFLICPNFCVRVDYNNAIDIDFQCPECGSVLSEQDNSRTITNLRAKITELENLLSDFKKSNILSKVSERIENLYDAGKLFAKSKKPQISDGEEEDINKLYTELLNAYENA
jgi:transcription initiation factor TFIIE subunit alpha